MIKFPKKYATQHLVSLNRFDISIEKVMDKMWSMLGGKNTTSLLPTLIGIEINNVSIHNTVPLFTNFLDQLIKLRKNHFTRFVTDSFWAEETKNGYIFYTHEGNKDARCDVIWTLSAMNDHQVEIAIRLPIRSPHHDLVENLSHNLKTFVPGTKGKASSKRLCSLMADFYRRTNRVYQTRYLDEDFHILLIPTENGGGYYPTPLHAMSYTDAKRHYDHVERNQHLPNGDVLQILLGLIQNTHAFDAKRNMAQERYDLTEMLFGMWATHHTCFDSTHDMIMFYINEDKRHTVNVYRRSMDEMYEERV